MAYAKTSLRREQRALRDKMRELGMSHQEIAVEFARRYRLRPRAAWRNAYGWSLTEAAERISTYAARAGLGSGAAVAMTAAHLSEHENWPGHGAEPAGPPAHPYLLSLLAAVYGCAVHDLLDVADYRHMPSADRLVLEKTSRSDERDPPVVPGLDPCSSPEALRVLGQPGPGSGDDKNAENPLRRRALAETARTSLLGSILDLSPDRKRLGSDPFVSVLTGHAADSEPDGDDSPAGLAALSAAANNARRQYQDCRYSELVGQLPDLLARLQAACLALDGDARSRALALSADAYHVAAGLLLKLDDQGLSYLAADRSMQAAQASEDPVTVGASARIMTHALMNGGHLAAAIPLPEITPSAWTGDVSSHTPESLSVYGSLLLRGAITAAQNDQRAAAHQLLNEADDAARRLGADANLRWTAFGPVNTRLHRVNIAVTLGDAGTAVDVACGTDLSTITVTERKATLLIDTTRAYLQWGRHEKAYIALRVAEQVAHEEVVGRPSVRRLIRQLVATAPPTLQRDVASFAAGVGVGGD